MCRRHEPADGQVCEGDRAGIAKMLADLPRKMTALEVQLIPTPATAGERVSTSRTGSPSPARLDALSLSGPGAGRVTPILHPHVRRWSTQHTVRIEVAGQPPVDRTITQWHQELAVDPDTGEPILAADDDQIGTLPPAEWLAWTVRAWREHFGHARRRPSPKPGRYRRELDVVERQRAATELLGIGGARRAGTRDPLANEWEARFGEAGPSGQPAADVKYLLTWLDAACDDADAIDLAATAAELRALTAELARILGDHPDQQWLGRCPAQVTDRDGGTARSCGAGLWQDPYTGVYRNGVTQPGAVECPRCHTVWEHNKLLTLAYQIRKVWPIDRRRRYHYGEIMSLPEMPCPGCGRVARVEWRNVTATTDDRLWWQPVKTTCANGCTDVERLL